MPYRCLRCGDLGPDDTYVLMFGEIMCRRCNIWVEGGKIEWPSPWELRMGTIPRVEWRYDNPDDLDPDPRAGKFYDVASGIEVMPYEIAAVYNRLAEDLEAARPTATIQTQVIPASQPPDHPNGPVLGESDS